MQDDPYQAWPDHDQFLAARLEQIPDSSSIELADALAAEAGLTWMTAAGIVEEYTFRKAVDTRTADWEVVRPVLLQNLRTFRSLIISIAVGHVMTLLLPAPMRTAIRMAGFVIAAVIILVASFRRSSRDRPGVTAERETLGYPENQPDFAARPSLTRLRFFSKVPGGRSGLLCKMRISNTIGGQ